MNYYPFHIGDYIAHTAHLDPIEDCAYRRLLDAYYLIEGPLPADVAACARQVRMKAHLSEVEQVLREFFVLTDTGWSHARCDAEIARMHDKSAKAKANSNRGVAARKAKHGSAGKPAGQPNGQPSGNPSDQPDDKPADQPGGQPNDEPAGHLPNTQDPISNIHNSPNPPPGDSPDASAESFDSRSPTPQGAVCMALKSIGIADVNPSHSKLLALLDSGVTLEAIVATGRDCVARGKASFRYVLGCIEHQEQDARNLAVSLARPRVAIPVAQGAKSFAEQDREAGMARWEEMTGRVHPDRTPSVGNVIDITPRNEPTRMLGVSA